MERDIILIIGGGGMSGIFSAGVLKSLEAEDIYRRIHSVYSVSVGACTGARFLARQSELGGKTFYTRFNNEQFIKGNFVRYFFQILRRAKSPNSKVDEILNFDYFTEVLLSSEDKLDMSKVTSSNIPLYVKVFNNTERIHQYLLVKDPLAYEKILASASMTPLTSTSTTVNGEELFDGDTIPSDIENGIAKNNPEKIIIKISNSKSSLFTDCNLFVLVVVYTLLRTMYGSVTSTLYLKNFFKRTVWRRRLTAQENVILIESAARVSAFLKDTERLQKSYHEGLENGRGLRIRLNSKDKVLL